MRMKIKHALVSDSWGIFLGWHKKESYWSIRDKYKILSAMLAPAFAGPKDLARFKQRHGNAIKVPKDARLVAVKSDRRDDYLSGDDCARAGLVKWEFSFHTKG